MYVKQLNLELMQISYYNILRNVNLGDCSNNGLSNRVTSALVFWNCTREEALAKCKENAKIDPALCFIIVERSLWDEDHSYAEPLIKPSGAQAFGGNFIYTSDGGSFKFKGNSCTAPIPVHDRFESWEQYDAMSR